MIRILYPSLENRVCKCLLDMRYWGSNFHAPELLRTRFNCGARLWYY